MKFDREVFYGDVNTLDLSKIRKEAEDRLRGDYYKTTPETTRIHFHKVDADCNLDTEHEDYTLA